MSVYVWLVVLILLFSFLLRGNDKGNKKYIIVAFILLVCVMGLRDVYTVGNDSKSSYLHHFQRMETDTWDDILHTEKISQNQGFSVLMKLGYMLTDGDYQMFIFLISAFVLFSFMRFINRYSPSPVQSVLYFLGLMFYTFLFDALKQSIAMAILLFSIDAIIEKKPVRFILLVVIASFFHFPALIFLPAYWIGNVSVGRTYFLILAAMLALTYVFRDQMLNLMVDTYSTEIVDTDMRFLANKVIIMIAIIAIAIILRPPTQSDRVYNAFLQLTGIAVVLQTFASYNNTFERLADYYFQVSIVFIPLIFERAKKDTALETIKSKAEIKTFAMLMTCGFAIWRFISSVEASRTLSQYLFYFQK